MSPSNAALDRQILRDKMETAEHKLRLASRNYNADEWHAAQRRYHNAVREFYLAHMVDELGRVTAALGQSDQKVAVLTEICNQLRKDVEFYQEQLAERVTEIKAGRVAAEEVLAWASADGQLPRAVHHILERLPDPDIDDEEEDEDDPHAECLGAHYSSQGVIDCDGVPV